MLQLHGERQGAQGLQQQRKGEAAAAAALREGATQAREHSQQAMRWVSMPSSLPLHRLCGMVLPGRVVIFGGPPIMPLQIFMQCQQC